jgi:site-specific DNA-methyltransferase (adenine-specific)
MITLNNSDLINGFEIQANSLVNDDCLNAMKFIPDNSISMILTDPPYGTTACKWDSIIPLEPMWEQLKRIIKPNGAIAMTASQPFTSVLTVSNLKMFKYDLVYEKSHPSGHLNANRMPMRKHESILVFYKKQPTYNPQKETKSKSNIRPEKRTATKTECYGNFNPNSKRTDKKDVAFPVSVKLFNNSTTGGDRGLHPTQKPVALMEYLIKTYTNESETVLDFTMGSGTTGVAAKNLNRKFIGIELDENYFQIAKERIESA